MSYWYNGLSQWWAHGCSKHVENWNKHIRKKNCASSWLFRRIKENIQLANYCNQRVISIFRREVYEICALLRYFAGYGGNYLLIFRETLSAPSSGVLGFPDIWSGTDMLSVITTMGCVISQESKDVYCIQLCSGVYLNLPYTNQRSRTVYPSKLNS